MRRGGPEPAEDAKTREPDAAFTKKVQAQALEEKLVLLTRGIPFNVIRFQMPLTILDAVFDEGLQIPGKAMEASAAA